MPPADAGALATALRRVIAEPGLQAALAAGARAARGRLPSWQEAARAFAAELATVAGAT